MRWTVLPVSARDVKQRLFLRLDRNTTYLWSIGPAVIGIAGRGAHEAGLLRRHQAHGHVHRLRHLVHARRKLLWLGIPFRASRVINHLRCWAACESL